MGQREPVASLRSAPRCAGTRGHVSADAVPRLSGIRSRDGGEFGGRGILHTVIDVFGSRRPLSFGVDATGRVLAVRWSGTFEVPFFC